MTTFLRYVPFDLISQHLLHVLPLLLMLSIRQRTLLFKGRFASADLASALSSKSATTPSCASFLSFQHKCLATCRPQRTHCEAVFGRPVINDDIAARNSPICRDHC